MADQQVSKLGIASVTLKATLAASARLWTSPFKGEKGAHTYFKDVMFAMVRTQLGNLTLAQDRHLNASTTEQYLKSAKDLGFAPESTTLPSGIQGHWIGNKNAKKVILYYHGGGYVVGASAGHFSYLVQIKDLLVAQGVDVGILIPAYDLAPEKTYPNQLRQGVDALRYLIEIEGRSPEDITLGGDSAGGNLTLGVLSHLTHPHPDIPALNLPTRLHAALLISPWCSFNVHTKAYAENAERDMLDDRVLSRWSGAFLGSDSPFAGDFYNEPVLAPAWWWEGTAGVVEEVLFWGGSYEVLIDGIEETAKRFQQGYGGKGGKVAVVISPKAAHVEPVVENILGYKKDSGTGSRIVIGDWLKAKL
ncbi:alpha/beta-hydrolase [Aaosphaeria arxii CBS 175.79]|uniref:Alpha/beta-hydrolase n=1 Tax=Aaosphaeria arxii CBS 175.79 TaxID=1450172 RepID=A0A6A5XEV1_9PLEO|nr:alpha/beta-hydrolase [Aaosphaeria arxii CBS 175.79]KAF2011450.1 alpha/beta-hydrolase [Aaosphaeria arxii CBS 175.79]